MRIDLRKYGVALLAAICAIACSKMPDDVLSEKEMQVVLTDMMIAEAMTGTHYQEFKEDSTKMALYQSVFRKHKISQDQYDHSLIWYGRNLDIYMKVYDRVVIDLDKRIANLGDVQAEVAPSSRNDSIDIWPRRNSFIMQPEAVFNGVVFDLTPETNYSSGSTFVLGVRFWGLKDHMKYKPEIRLSAEMRDTIVTVHNHIEKDGYYETVLQTMPTRQVKRVFGYIRMQNMDSTVFKVYADSLNLMKYNYGTAIPGH